MKVVIEIKRPENGPSDWRLTFLKKLNTFMRSVDVKDFHIEINGCSPCIVDWGDGERRRT